MPAPPVSHQPVHRRVSGVIKRLYHQVGELVLLEWSFSMNSHHLLMLVWAEVCVDFYFTTVVPLRLS